MHDPMSQRTPYYFSGVDCGKGVDYVTSTPCVIPDVPIFTLRVTKTVVEYFHFGKYLITFYLLASNETGIIECHSAFYVPAWDAL